MSPRHTSGIRRNLTNRLARSRDFSISLILHLVLVVCFGSRILFETIQEPPEMTTGGEQLYSPRASTTPPVSPDLPQPLVPKIFSLPVPATIPPSQIVTTSPQNLEQPSPLLPDSLLPPAPEIPSVKSPPPTGGLSREELTAIQEFRRDWVAKSPGNKPQEYHFTAYIGQYSGGNWNSTIRIENNAIEKGSLPNLLYFMSTSSSDKVKTNYKNVRAIRLDSDELFSAKPPFLFLTGTRDFRLSDKEVENLRKYVRLGGAIWGDSSVPGRNSRFDIAFRREMQRVLPDVDKKWETLPSNHPLFREAFFPEIHQVPAGLNFYREPVQVLKIAGQIAVIYTANDYGNMWQVGLDRKGKIDLGKNERGVFVATDPGIWNENNVYLRNLSPSSLLDSYKFGTNVVIHLLNRWEDAANRAPL